MKLKKLQITNFRNLNSDIVSFDNKINCIFGRNGNGKTNILEAVYVLCNRKSFRKNTSFPQLLSIDCEEPEVIFSSALEVDGELKSYSGKMRMDSSEWYLDGKPSRRKIDLKTVFINPFDSYEFHTTSSYRRNWIDSHFSLVNPEYKSTLSRFNKSLRFRNSLLKNKPSKFRDQINIIDKELSKLCFMITAMRQSFLEDLNGFLGSNFNEVFSMDHKLKITLDSNLIGLSVNDIFNLLQSKLEKDEIIGFTRVGSQKDDFIFYFDGFNAYEFCSLGQQKMSYLSLLFSFIELFNSKHGSYPIVLIDDVSGELDETRWVKLIYYLNTKEFQVLITTANEAFKTKLNSVINSNKIGVESGVVSHYS